MLRKWYLMDSASHRLDQHGVNSTANPKRTDWYKKSCDCFQWTIRVYTKRVFSQTLVQTIDLLKTSDVIVFIVTTNEDSFKLICIYRSLPNNVYTQLRPLFRRLKLTAITYAYSSYVFPLMKHTFLTSILNLLRCKLKKIICLHMSVKRYQVLSFITCLHRVLFAVHYPSVSHS